MKKLLSILMIVTMLLSMVAMAIPAAAADEEKLPKSTWEKPWMGFGSLDWVAIDTPAKLQQVFNGTVTGTEDAPRMYYLTKDIDLRGVERKNCNPNYVVLDGNGHTITFDSNYSSLFNNVTNLEVRNVIFKGDVKVTNDSLAFGGAICQWDVAGVIKMSNVLSLMNIEYARGKNTNQRPAAFVTRTGTGSTLTDVVFAGSMTISGGSFVQTIGGLVGTAQGTTFTNCTNKAEIIVAGPVKGDTAYIGIGGIAGVAQGSANSFVNCANDSSILISGFKKYKNTDGIPTEPEDVGVITCAGGIVGRSNSNISFENCTNSGIIMLADNGSNKKHMGAIGGILGDIEPVEARKNANITLTATNCTNNAPIIAVANGGWIMGGIVGKTWMDGAVTITGCTNNGNITTYNDGSISYDYTGVAGFIGYAYGAYYPNYSVTIKDSANNGSITSNKNGKANKEIWGGFIGQGVGIAKLLIENCINTGDVLMPLNRPSEFLEGSGGFVGGFRCVGKNWAAIYTSSNTFKNCYNLGKIEGLTSGGIFGDNAEVNIGEGAPIETLTLTLENCVNAGEIFGKTQAGGIAGEVGNGGGWTLSVKNCANGGFVNANTYAAGIFGAMTAECIASFENCVNYSEIGGEDASKAAGMIANVDPSADFKGCINIGKMDANTFAPLTNGMVGEAENNKYLISATVYANFDGAEGVENGAELIDIADSYAIPYAASRKAVLRLVETCEAMDKTKYLEGGDWAALETACTAAKAALDAENIDDLTFAQTVANTHHKAILAALSTIVEKADLTSLKKVITSAESTLTDGNVYTDATLEKLNKALEAAKKVVAQGEQAKVADVATCESELQSAIEKLKKKPIPLNFDNLNAAIEAVEALSADAYTAETWTALQTALTEAKAALEAKKQDEIDAATSALNKAKRFLEEKPTETVPQATEPVEEKGCGGLVGGAAVVLTAVVALGAGISFKKKED